MRIPIIDRMSLLNEDNFEIEPIDESSEYLDAVGKSDTNVQMIPIDKIRMNPKNHRSLEGADVLKESIRRAGRLFEPLITYLHEGSYYIISGHRRFTAWKSLCEEPDSSWSQQIPCIVVSKPADDYEEQILMSQANIHRSDPEEIRNEVKIAIDIWNSMPDDKRIHTREWLKKQFIESQEKEVTEDFIRSNFRPKLEFVRFITGIRSTNKTITKLIRGSETDQQETYEKPDAREKMIRKVEGLMKSLERYECSPDHTAEKTKYLRKLEKLREAIEHVW